MRMMRRQKQLNISNRCVWSVVLAVVLVAWNPTAPVANALSSPTPKSSEEALLRPMISLTGAGDVSGFLYGKLQRATSIYGSGLIGPATAIVHGDKDTRELLPKRIAGITNQQKQLKSLEKMLWNQFGMATCEASVEREDLLTPMSYLKPRLCEVRYTLMFLDATTTGMRSNSGGSKRAGGVGGGVVDGIGGLFASFLPKAPAQQQPQQSQPPPPAAEETDPTDSSEGGWIDSDLIQSAVPRGSSIFVVCESQDTERCAKALAECMEAIGDDNDSIITLVSPDDNVSLTGTEDARWNSLRPQDLEGELSQTVTVRDGTADCFVAEEDEDQYYDDDDDDDERTKPSFKKTREERLAAAYDEDIMPPLDGDKKNNKKANHKKKKSDIDRGSEARLAAASADYYNKPTPGATISRHDLAEVCVQCALRLPTSAADAATAHRVRVVRVTPVVSTGADDDPTDNGTERPNRDYFTMTGGPKAKARAGVVNSVDWARTLSCFAPNHPPSTGASEGGVKIFPKRPDVL